MLLFGVIINSNDDIRGTGYYTALGDSIAEITATANYGYHFDHWSYGSTINPDTLYLTEDVTITAYFASNQYTVIGVTNNSTYGTVTGDTTVNYLDTVTLTAEANTGYHFVRWSDYTIDNPKTVIATSDISTTAYFAPNEYTINLSVDTFTHGTCTGVGTYEYATVATLEAIPYSGYQFSHWSDGATYNPYTFAVTDDVQLTAFFYGVGMPYQDTIIVYDTLHVPVHDTIYTDAPYTVHDTTFVNNYIHDTVLQFVNQYVHDTTFVNNYIHDTVLLFVNQYVHDTAIVNNYIHDTVLQFVNQYVHDTAIINNYIHDTVLQFVNQYVYDTTFISNYIHDTVRITTQIFDTTITKIYQFDTAIYNTYRFDTIIVNNQYFDTVFVHLHDTIYITEEGIGNVEGLNAKVYSNHGQIVVEGADGNMVWLYDINGRVLATKRDEYSPLRFDVPVSGTYMIKIGNYSARKVVVIR